MTNNSKNSEILLKHQIKLLQNPKDEIIAFRAFGLHHTSEGPKNNQQQNCNFQGRCEYETLTENQWIELDYNYANAFDMNYFTAPYNGLYQFYANIRMQDDRTSHINMNDLIDFIDSLTVASFFLF